jgi:hypothetical protein
LYKSSVGVQKHEIRKNPSKFLLGWLIATRKGIPSTPISPESGEFQEQNRGMPPVIENGGKSPASGLWFSMGTGFGQVPESLKR